MFVFWTSLVAVPGVALANCWVLFRAWPRGWRLFGAGMLLPLGYGALALVAVHGSRPVAEFVMGVILRPFWLILRLGEHDSRAAMAAPITLAIVSGVAAWRERARNASA